MALRDAIQKAELARRAYAYRRITHFVQRGWNAVEGVVRRILRSDNLLAIQQRCLNSTANSEHGFAVYPNLGQYLQIKGISQLWVADITYLRSRHEFVYLAVVHEPPARPWENAYGESVMSTLKREQVSCSSYPTLGGPTDSDD